MLLIKNTNVYTPKFIGKKDIFICNGKIACIDDSISINLPNLEVIDAKGAVAIPGLIDKHIHITGGGGEGGFKTKVPELMLSSLIKGGITTVVGLLGTDSTTRSVENLVAKSYAFREEGISCYAHTGAYKTPVPTITGDILKDIVFIEPIIGIKLAISDHRSSSVTKNKLAKIASAGRVAGMLSGKSGHTTLHVGDGKKGLEIIYEVLNEYDTPITFFQPTHVNRNKELFKQAMQFAKDGGYIDLTCYGGERAPRYMVKKMIEENISLEKVTMSSDGYGSYSSYDKDGKLLKMGVSSVEAIYDELVNFIKDGFSLQDALPFVTTNVARSIGLAHKKGQIYPNFDADLLILNKDFSIDYVIANGKILKDNKGYIKKGTYENI
ncbi:beta-aspartyl-peptidase [Campylobacter geochelonis]|uniref:beta-aspartyl-peptidase n=1 Tax=Campylobacter geochelonis TaxID=1780362 RepID=UPI0007707598|nr:beta-aspartyl-peptidase [Campylobacter geochelonis]CZE47430.1 isoaspartyl dipeptidase [Campylobacter geochelonis]